jgi:hypothetical protein
MLYIFVNDEFEFVEEFNKELHTEFTLKGLTDYLKDLGFKIAFDLKERNNFLPEISEGCIVLCINSKKTRDWINPLLNFVTDDVKLFIYHLKYTQTIKEWY